MQLQLLQTDSKEAKLKVSSWFNLVSLRKDNRQWSSKEGTDNTTTNKGFGG